MDGWMPLSIGCGIEGWMDGKLIERLPAWPSACLPACLFVCVCVYSPFLYPLLDCMPLRVACGLWPGFTHYSL